MDKHPSSQAPTDLTNALEGLHFASDAQRAWLGCIIGQPHEMHYMVAIYNTEMTSVETMRLVHLDEMDDWTFYPTIAQLQKHYQKTRKYEWDDSRKDSIGKFLDDKK